VDTSTALGRQWSQREPRILRVPLANGSSAAHALALRLWFFRNLDHPCRALARQPGMALVMEARNHRGIILDLEPEGVGKLFQERSSRVANHPVPKLRQPFRWARPF